METSKQPGWMFESKDWQAKGKVKVLYKYNGRARACEVVPGCRNRNLDWTGRADARCSNRGLGRVTSQNLLFSR